MSTPPGYTPAQLDQAIADILGRHDHRRADGTLYWGDALLHCAERSFVVQRPEDAASAMVRHAIGLLDADLELPEPFGDRSSLEDSDRQPA
jgi:hypothetical protein